MYSNWLVKAMGPEPAHLLTASRFVGMAARRLVTRPSPLTVRGHLDPRVLPVGTRGSEPSSRTHRWAVRRSTTPVENLLELVSE
jgi:hypothetical protein